MTEPIHSALQAYPWIGLLLVALMAWLEYIFPPVPGDSTMLFACFLAWTGALSIPVVLLACLGGSIAGALSAYTVGARIGRSYFFLRSEWARAELQRLERGFVRFGAPLIAVNRFLPGVRGVFLYGAGIARLGRGPVAFYSTLSNTLWVALIAWCGASLGTSWDEVQIVFRRYVWAIAVVLTAYFVLRFVQARRRRRRAAGAALTPSS
jgi:membrane protein DedA with SNARE-associated domain